MQINLLPHSLLCCLPIWEIQQMAMAYQRELTKARNSYSTRSSVTWQYLATSLQPHFPSPFHSLNWGAGNQEVYLSEQSVNECDPSLLLKIDSHHQQ